MTFLISGLWVKYFSWTEGVHSTIGYENLKPEGDAWYIKWWEFLGLVVGVCIMLVL